MLLTRLSCVDGKRICSVCFHRNARRKVQLRIRHPTDPRPISADQLVRQFDSVWVFLISLVLFGKNLFQPLCLFFCNPLIHPCGIVAYEDAWLRPGLEIAFAIPTSTDQRLLRNR